MWIPIGIFLFVLVCFKLILFFSPGATAYDLATKPELRKSLIELCDKKLSKNLSAADRKGWEEQKKALEDLEHCIAGEKIELETEVKRLVALGKTSKIDDREIGGT